MIRKATNHLDSLSTLPQASTSENRGPRSTGLSFTDWRHTLSANPASLPLSNAEYCLPWASILMIQSVAG